MQNDLVEIGFCFLYCADDPRFWYYLPSRVKIPPAFPQIGFQQKWETPPLSCEEEKEIQSILTLSWTYLGKGNQCYVFESQGGEYVLKLFRYRFSRFSFVHLCKAWVHSLLLHRKPKDSFDVKINKTFGSAQLALTKAKECTEVVFCHLNLTEKKLPITQITTPSKTYHVPLDRSRFILQKKVIPNIRNTVQFELRESCR